MITQPGLAFRFDPAQGYLPMFKDRPTIVILASGSDFFTGMNRDRIDMATPCRSDRRPGRSNRSEPHAKVRIGGWPKWPRDSDPQDLIQRLGGTGTFTAVLR